MSKHSGEHFLKQWNRKIKYNYNTVMKFYNTGKIPYYCKYSYYVKDQVPITQVVNFSG